MNLSALTHALEAAAYQADAVSNAPGQPAITRVRARRLAESLRAEANGWARAADRQPRILQALVGAAVLLFLAVLPAQAQYHQLPPVGAALVIGNGGRVEEVVSDSVPGGGRARTRCTDATANGYPISIISDSLRGDRLTEVRAHEGKHRQQLSQLMMEQSFSCAQAFHYILSSPWRLAEGEIEASCTGYTAIGLNYGDQRATLQRIFQYFSREGVPLSDLARWDMKYCRQEPFGEIGKQSVAGAQ